MTKLNGVQSIGSIVIYKGVECVVKSASESIFTRNNDFMYEISEVSRSVGYSVTDDAVEIVVLKTPLKKHLTKLESLDKKIKKLEDKLREEMNRIEKENGWDEMNYDDYDNEHGCAMDGISFSMGLDDIHDERYDLLEEMANTAKEVKNMVVC